MSGGWFWLHRELRQTRQGPPEAGQPPPRRSCGSHLPPGRPHAQRPPGLRQTPGQDHEIIYCDWACAHWARTGLRRARLGASASVHQSLCEASREARGHSVRQPAGPGSGGISLRPRRAASCVAPSAPRPRHRQDSRHLQLRQPGPPSSGGLSLRALCCRISRTRV